ncbi:hypothetical protein L2449_14910 [Mesorhizobium muleiense]|nr:hypothetical protein [Mesorhizobium muleiense]MCF6118169.1 hypothetical protein [Mesorhizobium muleiense]
MPGVIGLVGDAGEDIGQSGLRIDVVELGGLISVAYERRSDRHHDRSPQQPKLRRLLSQSTMC